MDRSVFDKMLPVDDNEDIDEMKRMFSSFSFYHLQFLNKHYASLHF